MPTKVKNETSWKNYLIKAEQFFETAGAAYRGENWNAVGLNAVHSAISANDAITIYLKRIRSASEKHSDAVDLFLNVFNNHKEAREFSSHLLWLLSRKSLVEYEARLFYRKEAEDSIKHAERFLRWIKDHLPRS
ncbi:MAG: HEPN domain-containing protein [bacterium]|nr:HEPN domain-containing protein [bacterium]